MRYLNSRYILRNLPFICLLIFSSFLVLITRRNIIHFPDDGAYGVVARAILNGKVLQLDIQDVHAGYVNFINTFSLLIFGDSLVGIRGILSLLVIFQVGIVFILLRRESIFIALTGASLFVTLTYILFPNPTANWYSLTGAVMVVYILSDISKHNKVKIIGLGLLIGLVFLIRQLSGVFLGIGVLVYLLSVREGGQSRNIFASIIALLCLVILSLYCFLRLEFISFVLYGLFPIAYTFHLAINNRVSTKTVFEIAFGLATGVFISFLPLILYHFYHGSTEVWLNDTILLAFNLTELDFIDDISFSNYFRIIAQGFISASFVEIINSIFWIILLIVPLVLSVSCFKAKFMRQNLHPVSVVAMFFSFVSLHYQIPIYLFYTASLTLLGLYYCINLSRNRNLIRNLIAVIYFFISTVAVVYYHCQGPRTIGGFLKGEKEPIIECRLNQSYFKIISEECDGYSRLFKFILENISDGDTLLPLPVNPEVNYLLKIDSPARFYNAALGLASFDDTEKFIIKMNKSLPKIIIHNPTDKYNNKYVLMALHALKNKYEKRRIFIFDVYVLKDS